MGKMRYNPFRLGQRARSQPMEPVEEVVVDELARALDAMEEFLNWFKDNVDVESSDTWVYQLHAAFDGVCAALDVLGQPRQQQRSSEFMHSIAIMFKRANPGRRRKPTRYTPPAMRESRIKFPTADSRYKAIPEFTSEYAFEISIRGSLGALNSFLEGMIREGLSFSPDDWEPGGGKLGMAFYLINEAGYELGTRALSPIATNFGRRLIKLFNTRFHGDDPDDYMG